MPLFRHFLSIALLALAAPSHAQDIQPAPVAPRELPSSFADLVEKLSPAVVNISTTQKVKGGVQVIPFGLPFEELPDNPQFEPFREFFERFGQAPGKDAPEREVYSLGSGFLIDAGGYIITNNHVIDEAEDINVTLHDNAKYKAKLIGRDRKTDLALLKIEAKKPLPHVPLGDSDAARVGDWVIAIGNPYGLGGTVTSGIISARQRSINAGPFDDFLQTDAPINRGNSGGPLFNMKGEVIGIASAIFSPSGGSIGIGFAIPTALAKPVIDQLKATGHVRRGWLGVKIQEVSDEVADSVGLPKPMGALVLDVSKDSPAAKAGIQQGDVITHFDGKEIVEMRFLPRMVAETRIGKTVSLIYWRKNASKTVQVTLGELDETDDAQAAGQAPAKPKGAATPSETVLGMDLAPVSGPLREEYRIDDKINGLVVVEVKSGSEAAKRGIQPGDVLLDVGGEAVKAVADFRKAIDGAKKAGRKFALIRISRNGEEAFITLPTAEEKQ